VDGGFLDFKYALTSSTEIAKFRFSASAALKEAKKKGPSRRGGIAPGKPGRNLGGNPAPLAILWPGVA
jgi:hypothetical protein